MMHCTLFRLVARLQYDYYLYLCKPIRHFIGVSFIKKNRSLIINNLFNAKASSAQNRFNIDYKFTRCTLLNCSLGMTFNKHLLCELSY